MQAKTKDSFKLYLKLANDLDTSEPVIGLCCRMYYLEKIVELTKQTKTPLTPEDQAELMPILQNIEEGKKTLSLTKEEMKETIEDFCKRMFVAIDKEDRTAPKIEREHARRFLSTAHFIELLSLYGALTPKWDEMCMICSIIS